MAVVTAKNQAKKAADVEQHKTVEQYEAHPHQPAKQCNYRIPKNLLDGLQALANDSGLNKNEIINLALYNTLCSKGYENKKPKHTRTVKL